MKNIKHLNDLRLGCPAPGRLSSIREFAFLLLLIRNLSMLQKGAPLSAVEHFNQFFNNWVKKIPGKMLLSLAARARQL